MEVENNIFYKRLKELIEESGMSSNQVERDLGYPRNTLQNYKTGQEPSALRLKEISNYFGVTIEYLIGSSENAKIAPLDVFFRKLSFDQKRDLTLICQKWIMSALNNENDKINFKNEDNS